MSTPPTIESYSDYLMLDQLLELQKPQSPKQVHDETLFIVIHQTKELWFYEIIVELRYVRSLIAEADLGRASETLTRIHRIIAVLTLCWDVLATLPPDEFLRFRGMFKGASGLQSAQFREIEFILGIRDEANTQLERQRIGSKSRMALENELDQRSLWDEVNLALHIAGFPISDAVLNRHWAENYSPDEGVRNAWLEVYQKRREQWRFYRLGERLLDVSAALANWRSKHILTVERLIGNRPGTGGTDGVPYLQETLSKRAFPELWEVRNQFESSVSD